MKAVTVLLFFISAMKLGDMLQLTEHSDVTIVIDGREVRLTVLSSISAAAQALPVCQSYDLLPSDCNRLIAYVEDRIKTIGELAKGIDSSAVPKTKQPRHYETKESALPRSGVDYSRRAGPKLEVKFKESRLTLQAYAGESAEVAVRRFCAKYHIPSDDCSQVRRTFLNLVDGREEEHPANDSNSDTQKVGSFFGTIPSNLARGFALMFILIVYLVHWRDEAHEQHHRD